MFRSATLALLAGSLLFATVPPAAAQFGPPGVQEQRDRYDQRGPREHRGNCRIERQRFTVMSHHRPRVQWRSVRVCRP
ncbi:hypothetical protein EYW49_20435 [Siculibacillus lacustris]|uniref:Secreted protein n=1 Tax=Siculibacillus lacustris TaxID=1549641 RepID=A0A4Q9VGX0_9HYPH|nr:hypothetical protein [Siculibacillus lacustris]TBW33436.1 hypothetical protein EYW49_20435 [Siculibacillus lacustris]